MKRKDINTPEYWDMQFADEAKRFETDDWSNLIRWDAVHFDTMSTVIGHKDRVLDVGCGLGHLARFVEAKYPQCTVDGTDISPFAIKYAQKHGRGEYFISQPNTIAMIDNVYDVVILSEVLEHCSKPGAMIIEAHRVLKDEGILIVTTPEAVEGLPLEADHNKEYTQEDLERMLSIRFNHVTVYPRRDVLHGSMVAFARKGIQVIGYKKIYRH